jgi:hypothetical protein
LFLRRIDDVELSVDEKDDDELGKKDEGFDNEEEESEIGLLSVGLIGRSKDRSRERERSKLESDLVSVDSWGIEGLLVSTELVDIVDDDEVDKWDRDDEVDEGTDEGIGFVLMLFDERLVEDKMGEDVRGSSVRLAVELSEFDLRGVEIGDEEREEVWLGLNKGTDDRIEEDDAVLTLEVREFWGCRPAK